jgi:hypothetical protein
LLSRMMSANAICSTDCRAQATDILVVLVLCYASCGASYRAPMHGTACTGRCHHDTVMQMLYRCA